MKKISIVLLFFCAGFVSCKKVIDVTSDSNLDAANYYKTEGEVRTALNGCYNGLQKTMNTEWNLTEIRSDNTKMSSPNSESSDNRLISDLDMFMPATIHQTVYEYWLATYNNIRNANIVLKNLGVNYQPASGTISLDTFSISMSDSARKQLAGEAMFIRAYHYFNLVRLFGGVFLVHTPVSPAEAKTINRSSVAEIYKLIEADLTGASSFLSPLRYDQINEYDLGRANSWSAKGLLAKVYLTNNRKTEALNHLMDIKNNSGYGLQAVYKDVFSINKEMNNEILFTVRYKSGGYGLGSDFGNDFSPSGSGNAVINGAGSQHNYPTQEYYDYVASISGDTRTPVNLGIFFNGRSELWYVNKFLYPVIISHDGESDWPVLRYSDILLMIAEAKGYSAESVDLINLVRVRAGLPAYSMVNISTVATFERALSDERRLEFAFENQRFFDLVRFNTTLTTIKAEDVLKAHFALEYAGHYGKYPYPRLTLEQLQANVTSEHLLLPIPQREIDTNSDITIEQNPGY